MERNEYKKLVNKKMIEIIKIALNQTTLGKNINFFITFNVRLPGVQIPDDLKLKYPDQMSIILQHKFENLKVSDSCFSVVLAFSGVPKLLTIPFETIIHFLDRDSDFRIEFYDVKLNDENNQNNSIKKSSKIISLDQYKKKDT